MERSNAAIQQQLDKIHEMANTTQPLDVDNRLTVNLGNESYEIPEIKLTDSISGMLVSRETPDELLVKNPLTGEVTRYIRLDSKPCDTETI